MKVIITSILIGLAAFVQSTVFSQDNSPDKQVFTKLIVDFFKEEITLSVTDSMASVEGVYYFRNNTDKDFDFPVLFPFYVDSLTLYPHAINAYLVKNKNLQSLKFRQMSNFEGISIRIPLKAGEVMSWRLDYSQKLKANRAVYIITSTAAWHKPLEEATYYFKASETFTDIEIWPEADTTYRENGNIVFKCRREDFMPEQDMEINWK